MRHSTRSGNTLNQVYRYYMAGNHVGLTGRWDALLLAPGESRLACRTFLNTDATSLGSPYSYAGHGFGIDLGETTSGAVGEVFERYAMLDVSGVSQQTATITELRNRGVEHLTPSDLLHPDSPVGDFRQGTLEPIPDNDTPILWARSTCLTTQDEVLIPSLYCYITPRERSGRVREGCWYHATSNGGGASTSPAAACLVGAYELIERDAFMVTWYHRLRFPDVIVEPWTSLARKIDVALTGSRLEHRLLDLTSVHGVPTVIAVVRGKNRQGVQIGMGAAADQTVAHAAWRALKEALAYYSLQRRLLSLEKPLPRAAKDVRNFPDRPAYYLHEQNHHEWDFLWCPGPDGEREQYSIEDLGDGTADQQLRNLTTWMTARKTRFYAVDMTPPEAWPLGLFAYKVVSPDLAPLDWDHRSRHLTHPRLAPLSEAKPHAARGSVLQGINVAPHPFP